MAGWATWSTKDPRPRNRAPAPPPRPDAAHRGQRLGRDQRAGGAGVEGTKALATASHSIAASYGYADGENIPVDLMLEA